MLKWNQKTIHQWGIDTFGESATNPLGIAIRMAKEAIELTIALRRDEEVEVTNEAADVAIVILQLANCMNLDLEHILGEDPNVYFEIFDLRAENIAANDSITTVDQCADLLSVWTIDLVSSLFHGKFKNAHVSIMKIMGALSAVEELYEFDLNVRVQEKMEINVARKWQVMEDGSRQHV